MSQNFDIGLSFFRNIKNSITCFISLNKEKYRLFFDVLFVHLPYSDPELSRFF